MNHKLEIGSLVCFNSAGMKHKTLGVVLDFDFITKPYRPTNSQGHILIMWCVVDKYMPRTSVHDWRRNSIESGDIVWHEFGEWFVEVK